VSLSPSSPVASSLVPPPLSSSSTSFHQAKVHQSSPTPTHLNPPSSRPTGTYILYCKISPTGPSSSAIAGTYLFWAFLCSFWPSLFYHIHLDPAPRPRPPLQGSAAAPSRHSSPLLLAADRTFGHCLPRPRSLLLLCLSAVLCIVHTVHTVQYLCAGGIVTSSTTPLAPLAPRRSVQQLLGRWQTQRLEPDSDRSSPSSPPRRRRPHHSKPTCPPANTRPPGPTRVSSCLSGRRQVATVLYLYLYLYL
jgi:hypothetical protein